MSLRSTFFTITLCLVAIGYTLLTTPALVHADRGHVKILNHNVVTDNNLPLRGETLSIPFSGIVNPTNISYYRQLRDTFHLNTIRLLIYREPQNWVWNSQTGCGFNCNFQSVNELLPIIDQAVDAAAQTGIYLAIDYHPVGGHDTTTPYNNPANNEAAQFWSVVAPRYKNRTHVIYEVANEPVAWTPSNYTLADIKFEEDLYTLIRGLAPDTHIILWTFANGVSGMVNVVNQGSDPTGNQISYANASVGFHPYGLDLNELNLLKANNYPIIDTEIGGDSHNEYADRTNFHETIHLSWFWLDGANKYFTQEGESILPSEVTWSADPLAQDTSLTLTPTASATLPGDFNSDGVVDVRDFFSFLPHFGEFSQGNPFNLSGLVDIFDFNTLIKQL